ncbi:DUF2269 domain-containing protein [Streptomyces collinus]
MKLSRPARRASLVVHVVASAAWLGLTVGLLALGVTAATSASPVAVEAAVRCMKLFADWLLLPLALLTLASGLLLSLGTPWGLARHRWVYTKFWLTLGTTVATFFALRPGVDSAVEAVAAGGPLPDAGDVLFGPVVSLSAYVFMTVLSLLKPWGLTRRGRRLRERPAGVRPPLTRSGNGTRPPRRRAHTDAHLDRRTGGPPPLTAGPRPTDASPSDGS